MTTKHTPGPWELIWHGNEAYPYPLTVLANDRGEWVARNGTVSGEANARLIAAAPDLLAALKEIVFQCDYENGVHHDAIDAAKAAIAKAEGGE